MGKNEKPTTNAFPWKEFLGLLGVVLTAYIGYIGIRSQIEIPIQATQTAEARLAHSTATTSFLLSPVPYIVTVTPATLSPTATETLSPTAPPTQIAEACPPTAAILFSDTFDNNVNGWALGPRVGDITRQNREITDGALQLNIDYYEKGFGWINAPNLRTENFCLSIDSEIVQFSTRSVVGVVIAFRIANGGNTAYAIEFKNDGTFALYSSTTLRGDGKWQLVHRESSDSIPISEGTVNNFGVRVLGQRFTAYVNDEELFTFEDNSIRSIGEVGIGLSGETGKSAIVRFDNLLITK